MPKIFQPFELELSSSRKWTSATRKFDFFSQIYDMWVIVT